MTMSRLSVNRRDSKTAGERSSVDGNDKRSRLQTQDRTSSRTDKRDSLLVLEDRRKLSTGSAARLSIESSDRRSTEKRVSSRNRSSLTIPTKASSESSKFNQRKQSDDSSNSTREESTDDTKLKSILKKLSIKIEPIEENVEKSVEPDIAELRNAEPDTTGETVDGKSEASKKHEVHIMSDRRSSKFPAVVRTTIAARRTHLRFLNALSEDEISRPPAKARRVTRMFQSTSLNRKRRTSSIRPVLRYHPTFRLESHNPFDARTVEDILKKTIDDKMNSLPQSKILGDALLKLSQDLSDEVLQQVKTKNYDRYRILVNVTVGEKKHQSYNQSVYCLWDSKRDAMASCVYERQDAFVIVTVYGIYYD